MVYVNMSAGVDKVSGIRARTRFRDENIQEISKNVDFIYLMN